MFIYPSRSTEQSNFYPYRALIHSDQVHRIYLDELDDFWQLPLWVGLMVLTTVSKEDEAFEKAKYLIAQSQRQSPDESRAIIEMVATIISYQFTQLSQQEIYAMLDINVSETRIYQEVRQEAQASIIIRLLQKRFSAVSEVTLHSVSELSTERLGELSEALLDFSNLTDLQDWLIRRAN